MSFFSEVQSWFCAGFDGRYIGKIIVAWENNDREGFKEYFRKELGINLPHGYKLEAEYGYQPKRKRIADLAIFKNDQAVEPLVLIELKWNDKPIEDKKTGRAQLNDYVEFCSQHKSVNLLVLTKDALRPDEEDQVNTLGLRGQRQYFSSLSSYLDSSQSAVARMFLEYLQDKGVIMNDIDSVGLFRFFHRFVNPKKGSSRVTSEDQLSNGPEQFKNVLSNMSLIAQEISPAFYAIKGANRKATIDFAIHPYISKKALAKIIYDDGDENVTLMPCSRKGGVVLIYAGETISSSPWRQVEYGFKFEVIPNKEQEINVSIYAGFNGNDDDIWENSECENGNATMKKLIFRDGARGKTELVKIFKSTICGAINKADANSLLDQETKRQMRLVVKSLS